VVNVGYVNKIPLKIQAETFQLDHGLKNDKIETGISKLDEFLGGGMYRGKSLAYYIQPGIEGEVFGLRTIFNTLNNGGTGVFIVSSSRPKNIKNQFKDLGWNIDTFKDKLFFVDGFNSLIGEQSEERYVMSNPEDIEAISKTIINLFKELPPSTIVFESLSTIMDLCGEKVTIEAVKIWNEIAKTHDHVIIYNFTAWPYSQETLNIIKRELFNIVISIGGIAKCVILNHYFEILKSNWDNENMNLDLNNNCLKKSIASPKKTLCFEYEIDGSNVKILGENDMGCPVFRSQERYDEY
jgi:KaiC/GvpD/RAD55 family RecA-like ATPase